MIIIKNAQTYGWEAAIRGMRNPLDSWDKSDTAFWSYPENGVAHKIGDSDYDLMKRLILAGTEHGKFMRMIAVSMDVTAPLYWWKEFDTYKVGTVVNSCSTMHTLHKRELTSKDFSCENIQSIEGRRAFFSVMYAINRLTEDYRKTGDKKYWYEAIQLLPTSFNQRRTVSLNYAVLRNIYFQRKSHKLAEWREFCQWVESLPYGELITGGD